MNKKEIVAAVLSKEPWQYECWQDGSEHYKCFWCDAFVDEDYSGKRRKARAALSELEKQKLDHDESCLYLKLLES